MPKILPRGVTCTLAMSLCVASQARAQTAQHPTPHAPASAPRPAGEHISVLGRQATGTAANYTKPTATLGPLGNRRSLDVPFSVMTVPADVIANQQSRNVNDLMQFLPSVQVEMRGDPNTSRPQSRGFEADVIANSRVDGLNMVTTTPYPTEEFDSLQVLNGLAGALYGPQNPAGTFDYTLKRPTEQRINRLSFGIDSGGAVLEHADLSGRAGHNGWFGYRLNLLNQNGTYYVQNSWIRRNLVSGDFDIRLSPNTVIEIDASQYNFDERGGAGGFGYSTSVALPKAPDLGKAGWGEDYAGFNTETNTALAKIRHTFNQNWSMTFGGLYQNAYRDSFGINNAILAGSQTYQQTVSAATTAKNFKVGSNLAYLNGHFKTGFIGHDLVVGTNGYMMGNYNPTRADGTFILGRGSLSNPQPLPGHQPYFSGTYKSASVMNQTVLIGDTLHLDRHWSIMGTLAWSWLSATNQNVRSVRTSSYTKSGAFSPMTSLIYKPADNQTLYFTYGRSIQLGDTAPTGTLNQNEILAPVRSEEYEVGYKVQVHRIQMNVAGFRMTRAASFTDPATLIYGEFGQQRNYGVEFQAMGYLTPNLSVLGGVTWLDAQLGRTATPLTSNKEVVGVPPVQANVLLDYRLPFPASSTLHGIAVNANVHYVGRKAANVYNTSFADSYVTLSLGARYAFRVAHRFPAVARLGVDNVTNERYWSSLYPSNINGGATVASTGTLSNTAVAGLPRTYHFSIEADF